MATETGRIRENKTTTAPADALVPCLAMSSEAMVLMKYAKRVQLCNIGYPSETYLKLKFREMSFLNNSRFGYPIVVTFCTEHGSDTAVLCAKFQNDWTTAK